LKKKTKVIIVGAGFGGLFAAKRLANELVDVILIDKNNYHTFSPLLYQVATCALDPSEIAYPIRAIFRRNKNIRALLGEVTEINNDKKFLRVNAGNEIQKLQFEYLLLASGSDMNFFGNDSFEKNTHTLKSLQESIDLRNHVLRCFERAVWIGDPTERESLLTLVVVGGGPTGVETAGALFELYNHVLDQEYPNEKLKAKVVLVEMLPVVLGAYPERLSKKAEKQLETLGVELVLNNGVSDIREDEVELEDGTIIPSKTVVWSVGVRGTDLGAQLGVDMEKGYRVPVDEYMRVQGESDIFAVGDMAYLNSPEGEPYPQLIPVAEQQGVVAAENILSMIKGKPLKRFEYRDWGIMATIGRSRAVAWLFYRFQLSGFIAWLAWLFFHLITLVGFRNRLNVLVNWVWNYLTYDRSVRLILEKSEPEDF
jgi:NADH dehydrogenase